MWKVLFLLAIVFVLSYDPNTKTIERFVGDPTPPTDKSCQAAHFQAVQFAASPYQCPKETNVRMGAITA
jgi:hypothetical protein